MIAAFIAGFIAFPLLAVAIVGPWAYRQIKRGMDW